MQTLSPPAPADGRHEPEVRGWPRLSRTATPVPTSEEASTQRMTVLQAELREMRRAVADEASGTTPAPVTLPLLHRAIERLVQVVQIEAELLHQAVAQTRALMRAVLVGITIGLVLGGALVAILLRAR